MTEVLKLVKKSADAGRPFLLNFWPYGVHTPLQARPDLLEKYKAKVASVGSSFNPTYCAMLGNIDENVGRLLKVLEEIGIRDNTLILFTSDNGGLIEVNGNKPLRAGKGHLYEGGIRVPLLISQPGSIPKGRTSDVPVAAIDFLPTLLNHLNLKNKTDVDGKSFQSLLTGNSEFRKRPLIWHYPHYHTAQRPPQSAIRIGDYKLIHFYEDGRNELYNLRIDPYEQKDLAMIETNTVKTLYRRLMKTLNSMQASFPYKNPDYDASDPFGKAFTGWNGENRLKK
jgi:arylsulfatase A-like enzyme